MEVSFPNFSTHIKTVGLAIDGVGVAIIVLGAVFSLAYFAGTIRSVSLSDSYRRLRANLGRTILLGLEFLVAGDIIRTVAVSPTYSSVGVLGLIILIRFFISVQLEMEIDGSLPWKRGPHET